MTDENPLKSIFKISSKGIITEQINSINKISSFFTYLKNEKIPSNLRSQVIEELINKIKINRGICEYFSFYGNQSIYLFLFELYINKSTSSELKSSIINLISELRINLDINKSVFDYVFQKIAAIYRQEESSNDLLYDYLYILNILLGETFNQIKPRNYFCCQGKGCFEIDLSNMKIKMGCSFTIILNFKIISSNMTEEEQKNVTTNLVTINFSNSYSIHFDLKEQILLFVNEVQTGKFLTNFNLDEWTNLIINVVNDEKNNVSLFMFINGQNRLNQFFLKKPNLTSNDTITKIKFFNNFYGEVSSMTFLSQKDHGYPGVNSNEFLLEFKNYKEGLWKKKKIDSFLKILSSYDSIGVEKTKSKTVFTKKPIKLEKKFDKIENEESLKLIDNLIFIFTPLNYSEIKEDNIVENVFSFLNMEFSDEILPHKYKCFQKNLGNLGVIDNLFPIAEMFIIHPKLLNENNFEMFLKIIYEILNNRKYNMQYFIDHSFFQILSLFIEKYPKNVFTEKIINAFTDIGKCMFAINFESLSSIYFEHILLNEKICSKYSEDLQLKFWNHILLFFQSDSSQIERFISVNRICLILRFYDRNKYSEMCCQRHLSMIKEEYIGNKTIMNPPMDQKLNFIENIMNFVINSQEPEKAFSLFKLLTLDLSPCLTEFILNIFIKVFQKETNEKEKEKENIKWKDDFINVLFENKLETIILNTFDNSLPEIKLSVLKLLFEINYRLSKSHSLDKFKNLQNMLRPLILPQENFYSEEKIPINKMNSGQINDSPNTPKKSSLQNDKNPKKTEEKKTNFNKIQMPKPTPNTNKKEEDKKPTTKGNSKVASMISKLEGMGNRLPGMMGGKPPMMIKPKEKKDLSKSVFVPSFLPVKNQNNSNDEKPNINSKPNANAVLNNKNNNKSDDLMDKFNFKLNLKNENNEVIIFKEKIYYEYVENMYDLFILWSLNLRKNTDIKTLDFKSCNIENKNGLEFLISLALEVNNINFDLKTIKIFELLSNSPQNAYILIDSDIIISFLLEIAFKYYMSKDKQEQKCYEMIKSVIFNCFINSLSYLEKTRSLYPCDKLEFLFLAGDKILFKEKNTLNKDLCFNFLSEFLFELLTAFEIKSESQMNFHITNPNFNSNPLSNFYLKNYLILTSHLFRYSFNYKHDQIIRTEGTTFISLSNSVNCYLIAYITGMRLNPLKGIKITEQWVDFQFFNDIHQRIKVLWNKIKNFDLNIKKDKMKKYKKILEKVILNKDKKNIYQKELELLCYEEIGVKKQIIPLIKIISIGLMCLVNSSEDNKDFLDWLKELKKFIRFLIISSSNMVRTNQLELYIKIQDKCLDALISCLCFLKELLDKNNKWREKIEKTFQSILLFCGLIVKYQYNYLIKHKGLIKIKISGKPSRNDLLQSAVFILFHDLIKNKNGEPLLDQKELDPLDMNKEVNFINIIEKEEWNEAFFENNSLRERICNNFFCVNNYKKIVDNRGKLISNISNEKDEKYKTDILELLPLYEKELLKYSNNSLEKNIKIKNIYKKLKKNSFSWHGYWSDRKLFFQNSEKLKFKLMNHLTKTLMKPLLVPILDISYYLPEFSGFNPETLFNKEKNEIPHSKTKLIMDIDKVLKSSEQNNIKEIKKNFQENENFLREIYTKSNPQLAESLTNISNNLDFGKEDEFTIIKNDKNDKKEQKKYYLSCLVKTSHHIKGVCFIDDNNLNFKVFLNQRTGSAMSGVEIGFTTKDDDYDQERQTCFGSFFVCHPKDKDLSKISIAYNNIKMIFRRRYYYQNSALEIFTTTNKTFYFNFKYEKDREDVINEILNKLNEPAKIIDDLKDQKDIFENVIGFENVSVTDSKNKGDKKKKIKVSKKIELWKEWKMTNYELLMWLNIYGNRSFNDISQYPVFPWILNSYEDPLVNTSNSITEEKYNLRDMNLPMGMLALDEKGEQRKEMFLLNYETLKGNSDDEIKPFFYGSNYSNPIYVCNYLMRIFPFTHIAIELQGSKFDQPDRLFISVKTSFNNSTTQKTDVRELIPEFFYLPEIFLNINDLNMGVLENGKKVNNILTPCHNNPYEFVKTMKTILESNELSNIIQNWVDLIFGYKAKGKEAESSFNLFSEASYQETIDIKKVENKESYLRMVEFGLIPSQVMGKECGKRDKKEDLIKGKEITDSEAFLINYDCKAIKDQTILKNNKEYITVLVGCELSPDKITLVLSTNAIIEIKISYSIFDRGFKDEIINIEPLMPTTNKMKEFYVNEFNKKAIQLCSKSKMLIMGGFYDGKIIVYLLEEKIQEELMPFNNDCPILSICVSQDEEYLLVGNSNGNVGVYKIDTDIKNWKFIHLLTDQIGAINHIHCNNDLNLWASTSIDGYINIYTLPLCKLVRTINVITDNCSYSFLISSPLPCIVVIHDGNYKISNIDVYSINGKNLSSNNDEINYKIRNPIIIKDLNSYEYLAYVAKNVISIRYLPSLDKLKEISISPKMGITYIFTSEDKKSLYCINKNGSNVYVIRDEIKKNIRNASVAEF